MRLAAVNDNIFDELINDNDKIVYNLFLQIKNDPNAFIVTNDISYIFTQDSRRTPNWVFLKESPDEKTKEELIALISGMVRLNPLLRVNGDEEYLRPILDKVSEISGVPYKEEIPMEVFFCRELKPMETKGKMVPPHEKYRERLKEIITSMSRDDDGMIVEADDSEKYIASMVHSNAFFLWEDEKIVSIAKVAHRSSGFARINTIFTAHEERGNGYTKMLVHEVSVKLMNDGYTPVIYADARNEKKSLAYKEVGFESAGNITQFAFVQKL